MRLDRQGVAGLSQTGRSQCGGQLANVGLGEASFDERAADGVLAGGLHAGSIIAPVVEVGSVHDDVEIGQIRCGSESSRSSWVYSSVLQK